MTAEFPLAFWPWKPPYEFVSLLVRPHYAPGFVNFLRNIADVSGDKDSFFPKNGYHDSGGPNLSNKLII